MELGHLDKLRLFALLPWCLILCILMQSSLGQNVNQQDCETTENTGMREYRACLAKAEALYNLNIIPSVEPENHTCGYGDSINERLFCTLVSEHSHLCFILV